MAMQVPFLDLLRQQQEIGSEIIAAVARVLDSGVYILGREVVAFESEWARYCGVRAAAGVANGTEALTLALIATGAVRKGYSDEVITTPLTAAYTALAIRNAGGVPVFADIDPHTYTLAPSAIENVLTPRTRAIVPVHLYGQMAAMEEINDLACRYGLIVIEDAAQAHGAKLKDAPIGSFGHAAAFSFYPTKNLGACGDGGAVVSNDEALIEQVKILRQGGHPAALQNEAVGCNSRLDEMQAAILRVKLQHLERWTARRRAIAARYLNELQATDLVLPQAPAGHAFHLFVVQHADRERRREHLRAGGIETLVHYPYLLHQQPLFRRLEQPPLPVAERIGKKIFSLPLYSQLTEEEVSWIITVLKQAS